MVCHGIPWHTMVYHGMPWHTMAYHVCHGAPWHRSHGVPWYTMVKHGQELSLGMPRHINLAELTWQDSIVHHESVEGLSDDVFGLRILQTKTLSKNARVCEFFLADAISEHLFRQWWQLHSPELFEANKGHRYLFPAICKGRVLDWSKPYTHLNHSEACVEVAVHCGHCIAEQVAVKSELIFMPCSLWLCAHATYVGSFWQGCILQRMSAICVGI